jgi:hypothetical protein
MEELFTNAISAAINAATGNSSSGFTGGAGSSNTIQLLSQFLAFVLIYVLLLIFGKFLWNEFLTKYISIAKPVTSIIDLLAMSILLRLFF